MSLEIVNAQIKSTMLGIEDHGIMTCFLHLDFAGSVQGFGGYAMDVWVVERKVRVGTAFGMELIGQILRTVGVEKWEDLPGKYVRAYHDYSKIYRIGHIIEDTWLDIAELAKSMEEPPHADA